MEDILKKLTDGSTDILLKVLVALVVMIIGFRIISFIENRLKKPHRLNKIDNTGNL